MIRDAADRSPLKLLFHEDDLSAHESRAREKGPFVALVGTFWGRVNGAGGVAEGWRACGSRNLASGMHRVRVGKIR